MFLGTVYPDQFDTTLAFCYVNINVKEIALCFINNGANVTLTTIPNDAVEKTDEFVLPIWACNVLRLSAAYRSSWQWIDTSSGANSLQIPVSWRFDWPDGVTINVLSSMIPALLQGTLLSHNSYVAIKVFDLLMIFHVILSGDCDEDLMSSICIEWSPSLELTIKTTTASSNDTFDCNATNAVKLSSPVHLQYVCYPTVINRLVHSFQCLVQPSIQVDQRFLVKTYLLCAPEGAGKSYLMSQFIKQAQCYQQQSSLGVLCVTSSCSVLTPSSTTTLLSSLDELLPSNSNKSSDSTSSSSSSVDSRIFAFVKVLMSALAVPDALQSQVLDCCSNRNVSNSNIVWVIDGLDPVLHQYASNLDSASDNNEDSVSSTIQLGNEFQIVGYVLNQLLKLLSERNHSSTVGAVNLMIVGACRLDVRQVPRSHTGAPEFEKVLSLSRLSGDSRQAILSTLLEGLLNSAGEVVADRLTLGTLPSSLVPENTEAGTGSDDGVTCWSHRLAGLTAGYCPGDLVAMVNHASLLHRGKAGMLRNKTSSSGDSSSSESNVLEWETMMQSMLSLPPKQLQSLGIESSSSTGGSGNSNSRSQKLNWDDFAGYSDVITLLKRLLTPRIPASLTSPEASAALSPGEVIIPPRNTSNGSAAGDFASRIGAVPKGIVLYGPTGCGKSLLARIIASEAKMNFVSIRSTEILSKYFGQTERAIRTLFQKARSAAPCVLFFDEFDAIAYKRGAEDEGGNGLHGRVLSTFLNELDGVTSSNDRGFENSVMVLAACADVSTLDEALVRPGRLQYHILLDKPTCEDVQCILRNQLRTMPVDESVNVLHTATLLMTMHPSCADAEALCQKALFGAIREHIHSQSNNNGAGNVEIDDKRVRQSHFNQALSELTGLSLDAIVGMKPREAVFQWSGSFNVSL